MTDALRIAHCADIHLDGEIAGRRASEHYRNGFAAALADIRAHKPDLMLFAGDLFDTNRASPETVAWAMEALSRQPFPVVMIPGNHDCLEEGSIYRRHDFNRIPNVQILTEPDGGLVRVPQLSLAAWGKGMVEHTAQNRPLAGCPERPSDCRWFVGLGHGMFVPHGDATERSSPIHMGEIEASACDYLALGHHHAAMEIVTDKATAAYSGSPTDNLGRGATYVIAELAAGRAPLVTVHTVTGSQRLIAG
jgi:DNA repair exonuclease SbcCD nuclease subunit